MIPRSTRLAEAPSFGKPIIHYDKYSSGSAAWMLIWTWSKPADFSSSARFGVRPSALVIRLVYRPSWRAWVTIDLTGKDYAHTLLRQSLRWCAYEDGHMRRGKHPGLGAVVTKLMPAGNGLVYSTYLGGSGTDAGIKIAVDGAGSAYLTGQTLSGNFPTQSPYQSTYQGGASDGFVTKLSSTSGAAVTVVSPAKAC